jgi:hypothetical protein
MKPDLAAANETGAFVVFNEGKTRGAHGAHL